MGGTISSRAFARHFFEMAFPMMLGCGATCIVAFGVLAINLSVLTTGVLFAVIVTINMTIPMALWMRYPMHHSWKSTAEMSVPMFFPLVGVIPPYLAGLIPGLLLCPLICTAMFPLMLVVMIYRRGIYGQSHQAHMSTHEHVHTAME